MIGREEIQRMRVQIFVVLEGVSEQGGRALCPLCFHQFVPSPFCEGARSAARSKGLAPNLLYVNNGLWCHVWDKGPVFQKLHKWLACRTIYILVWPSGKTTFLFDALFVFVLGSILEHCEIIMTRSTCQIKFALPAAAILKRIFYFSV
jgi:hypothetical protein